MHGTALSHQTISVFPCASPWLRAPLFHSALPEPPKVEKTPLNNKDFCGGQRPCRPLSGLSRAHPHGSVRRGSRVMLPPDPPGAYQQGCRVGPGPGKQLTLAARTRESPQGGQLWEHRMEVRSSGARLVLVAPCLAPHAKCLWDGAASRCKSQGSSMATRDGVSEEVGFGRGNLTLKTFCMIQIINKKILRSVTNAGQSTSLTLGNMSCFSCCFSTNSALEVRNAKPGSSSAAKL